MPTFRCETHGLELRVEGERGERHAVALQVPSLVPPACRLLRMHPVAEGQHGPCRIVRVDVTGAALGAGPQPQHVPHTSGT